MIRKKPAPHLMRGGNRFSTRRPPRLSLRAATPAERSARTKTPEDRRLPSYDNAALVPARRPAIYDELAIALSGTGWWTNRGQTGRWVLTIQLRPTQRR